MKFQCLMLSLLIIFAIITTSSENNLRYSNIDPIVVSLGMEHIASAYQKMVSLFGVSVKREITQLVSEKGFDYFDASSQVIIYSNFDPVGLPRFKKLLISKWEADDKGKECIETLIELIELTVKNQWSEHDIIFQKGTTGEMVYGALFSYENNEGLYTFVIMDSRTQFKLSKDLYLVKTTKSIGKIASSENTKIIYKERGIELEDIDSMMYFLQIVAYKQVAQLIGLKLPYPSIQ